MEPHAAFEDAFARHRGLLWQLCYRMLGSRQDAEDTVQDTFERALETPPPDLESDLRPWLIRVAMNRCRDQLRRRARVNIDTWLPDPIALQADSALLESQGPHARYSLAESASLAFLRTFEALTPTQRAVLLLRDVLDYSIRETAETLATTEGSVKTTLHRSRRIMADYDKRQAVTPERVAAAQHALKALLLHLELGNAAALRTLLAEDLVVINDADDGVFAARKPVRGVERVILFHQKTRRIHLQRGERRERMRFEVLNGAAAIIADMPTRDPRVPSRAVCWIELDDDGRIDFIGWQLRSQRLDPELFQQQYLSRAAALGQALRSAWVATPPRTWLEEAGRTLMQRGGREVSSARRKLSSRYRRLRRRAS